MLNTYIIICLFVSILLTLLYLLPDKWTGTNKPPINLFVVGTIIFSVFWPIALPWLIVKNIKGVK